MNRYFAFVCLAALVATAQPGIDWKHVVELREKQVRGTMLSPQDQEYLTKALASLDSRQNSPVATRLALAGLTGDGAGEVFQAQPVRIGLDRAPVEILTATAADGRVIQGSYRRPPGKGPFPAVLMIHGGLDPQRPEKQSWFLTEGPVHTRLLAAGFVVAQATFRSYDRQNLLAPGPDLDVEALYLKLRSLPGVDPDSVALFGGSGGGSLALEIASREKPAAVIAGEPATILFAGMLKTGEYEPRLRMMGDPEAYYKAEQRQLMESKLKRIQCPLLLLSGDIHPLKVMNHEILLPAAIEAGVKVEWRWYKGEGHGFYFGSATPVETVMKVLQDVTTFLGKTLPVSARSIAQ